MTSKDSKPSNVKQEDPEWLHYYAPSTPIHRNVQARSARFIRASFSQFTSSSEIDRDRFCLISWMENIARIDWSCDEHHSRWFHFPILFFGLTWF
ncbi:hypothetical protein K443DRAFT_610347 [Laccaria amethystina LaAM-08-1]|uniref:Uncharacterized protein n=1 Tax=Laccaria amethystina LaAM-08-1 TaxID=1095629 RepID=A0A0C9X7B5_9AGAR|nr:hypothetical protein K443DRAFT_610347 [Laccaria amethystina LaAM-08-1]